MVLTVKRAKLVLGVSLLALFASSCATVATQTLKSRLSTLGLSDDMAVCVADDLGTNLSQDDFIDLTRYTYTLSAADSPLGVIQALSNIDNPAAVSAVLNAGRSCLTTSLFGGL